MTSRLLLLKVHFTLFITITLGSITNNALAQPATENNVTTFISKGDSFLDIDPRQAKLQYEQAYLNLQHTTDSILKADIYRKLGEATYLLGTYPRAITYMKQALEIYDGAGYDSLSAELLRDIGSSYYFGNFDEPDKALEYFQRAHDKFMSLSMDVSAEYCANYMAYVYWAAGEKEKALKTHLTCLDNFKEMNQKRGMATCASDAGFTLNSLERYTEALNYNKQALAWATELDDSTMIIPILNNIGISHLHLNNLKLAKSYSEQSLKAAQRRGLNLRKKEALSNLHQVYAEDGNYAKAYSTHQYYKSISDSINNISQLRKLVQLEEQKEFAVKESELKAEQAKKEIEAKAALEKEQTRNRNLFIGLLLLLIITVLLIIAIRTRVKLNKSLKAKNEELQAFNSIVEEKNEELETLLDQLKTAQSKLIQYEKLAALGTLTTGVAHEINNPLNFIQAGVYALEEILPHLPSTKEKLEALEILDHIRTGMTRINYTVTELNRFSKNSISKDFVSCDVKVILQNSLTILKPDIDPAICSINLNFASENLTLIAHEGSLHQVFTNIIQNSILAITSPGTIDITAKKDTNNIEITIADSGCGMDEVVLFKACDPFFTTRAPGEGMGLGLYVSYKLIQSHHGTLDLKSSPGKGTTAIITLPINPTL